VVAKNSFLQISGGLPAWQRQSAYPKVGNDSPMTLCAKATRIPIVLPGPAFLRSSFVPQEAEILPELTRVVRSFEAHLRPPSAPCCGARPARLLPEWTRACAPCHSRAAGPTT
jgi:hypothetical protein